MACLQQFLRESGGYALEQLQKAPYFLKIKQHKKYPNLYLFKYDQINSKMQNPIVQEARGIILDSADNWKIVSYPYNKFFNYGEPHAVQIDWNSSIIYEKEDGSLMTLYYYKNEWHVSSSGVPDASGNAVSKFAIENRNMTFHQLFWKIWKELNYPLPEDTEKCYIFEMLSPFNQIIVPQKSNRIVLHGVRCLATLQEHRPEPIASKYGWELIRSYSFNNMEEVLKFSNNLSPSKSEGYVVCDAEFLRIKVKARTYVELAHMSSKMSMGDINLRLLKIAQTNEGSEVLTHFPEYNEPYVEIKKMYKAFVDHVESIYEDNKHHKTRKELAGAIKGHWFQSCIFLLFDERIKHANEWTSKCDTRKLLPHLNEYKTR